MASPQSAYISTILTQLRDFDAKPVDPDAFVIRPWHWQLPLGLAAGLLLTLFVLFLVGQALSAADLRKTAGGSANVPRTSGLYPFVLWLAVIAFYAWFPVIVGFAAVIALGISGVALMVLLNARFISPRLILLLGGVIVLSLMGLLGVITAFFLEPRKHGVRRRVTAEEAPELFAALEEAARAAGTRPADDVYLRADTTIAVHEEGRALAVLFGKGRRVVELGISAMRGFTVTELKAVLGHEFGHFAGGDTRVSPVIANTIERLATIHANYESLGVFGLINPVYWYVRGYLAVFLRIASGLGRRRELAADHVTATTFGGEAFAAALSRVGIAAHVYARYTFPVMGQFRRNGRGFTRLDLALDAIEASFEPGYRERYAEEEAKEKPHPYDSHPPRQQRVEAVRHLKSQVEPDRRPWTVLFPGYAAAAASLTGELVKLLDRALEEENELPVESIALAPEQESRMASAFASVLDVYRLSQQVTVGEAETRLQKAIARLEEAAGPEDPTLIGHLVELARLHAQTGKAELGATTATRALEIARARSATAIRVMELQGLVNELRGMAGLKVVAEPPPAVRAPSVAAPAADAPKQSRARATCSKCQSVVDLEAALKRGTCEWCEAPFQAQQSA